MSDYVILLAPSSNRVYSAGADVLAAAELEVLLGSAMSSMTPVTIAGLPYLQVSVPDLDAATLATIGRLSSIFALFERDGDLLRPVEVDHGALFDDDLVTIPKYQGKTNEQFTRLLMNVTLASVDHASTSYSILDPLCGRGTTLSIGLTYGHQVAGVDADVKAIEAYSSFLRTYLRRKRLKHTAELNPVRRDGKSIGRRLEVDVTAAESGTKLRLDAFTGDTRQSAVLYGKRRFDAIVTDAPYGIVHGSQTDVRGVSGKRDRSPAGLLKEAIPVWASQLKGGGALGLAWNTYGLSREDLSAIAVRAGLEPLNDGAYLRFSHRVDSSIQRDVFVAVKPRAVAPSA